MEYERTETQQTREGKRCVWVSYYGVVEMPQRVTALLLLNYGGILDPTKSWIWKIKQAENFNPPWPEATRPLLYSPCKIREGTFQLPV